MPSSFLRNTPVLVPTYNLLGLSGSITIELTIDQTGVFSCGWLELSCFQFAPPSMLLNILAGRSTPAYSVSVFCGSIAIARTDAPGNPAFIALQLAPPSVLL